MGKEYQGGKMERSPLGELRTAHPLSQQIWMHGAWGWGAGVGRALLAISQAVVEDVTIARIGCH